MELQITGSLPFLDKTIPVVTGGFGKDKKCISDKTIAEIHNQPMRQIRRRINDNINRFRENVDFIDLKKDIAYTNILNQNDGNDIYLTESVLNDVKIGERLTLTYELLENMGYTKQSIIQPEHIYILSERGYAKLIKIMDTDLAWQIHDKLVDDYFRLREERTDYLTRTEFISIMEHYFAKIAISKEPVVLSHMIDPINDPQNTYLLEPEVVINEDTDIVPGAASFREKVYGLCSIVMKHNSNMRTIRSVLNYVYRIVAWETPFEPGIDWEKEKQAFESQTGYVVKSTLGMLANMSDNDRVRCRFLKLLTDYAELLGKPISEIKMK